MAEQRTPPDPGQVFLDQLAAVRDLIMGGPAAVPAAGQRQRDAADAAVRWTRAMTEQARAPAAHLETFVQELRAKRALINAMQLQLTAFDQQMESLERALAPLQEWSRQWSDAVGGLAPPTPGASGAGEADAARSADAADRVDDADGVDGADRVAR